MAGESAAEVARRRRGKAERLARQADLYDQGAEGERRTALAMATLPTDTWHQLHDVRWPGRRFANVDHVVVGPGGVFVIDSKNWSGTVTVDDRGVLRQNGRAREAAVAGAGDAAQAVAELLPLPLRAAVTPAVCLTRDEPVSGWANDVLVCSTENVHDVLLSAPARLTLEQVDSIHDLLARSLDEASVRGVGERPSARRASAGRAPSARRRTGAGAELRRLAGFLVTVVLLYLLLTNLDTVTDVLAGPVSEWITGMFTADLTG